MSLHSNVGGGLNPGALATMLATGLTGERDNPEVFELALAAVVDAEKQLRYLQARIDFLEGLSVTDELTGLLNRRGFAAQIDRALAAARRTGERGALLVCDLDKFKQINDRCGHAAGDEVLRHVAQIFLDNLRRTDVVGRLGGDEFALLLVGASDGGAERKAASFRKLIAEARFGEDALRVGVSIGCVHYSGAETAEELFARADAAMYSDKRRGHSAGGRGRLRPVPVSSVG